MKRLPKITVSIPFCILLSIMYLMDFGRVFLPTLIAVVIHETAHILAIMATGGKIDRISVKSFGISVNVPNLSYMSYTKEIIIAAAGPVAGLVAATVAALTAKSFDLYMLDYFVGINIVITAINILPVYPLDGGRIALALLLKFLSLRGAYVISYMLSIVSIGAILGICVYSAASGNLNPSLVVFSVYVAICGVKFRPVF